MRGKLIMAPAQFDDTFDFAIYPVLVQPEVQ